MQIRNSQRKEDNTMPELSRFEGMVIKMLFNDTVQHNKPHVHVTYGEYKASVGIDGELLAGSLPQKQFRMLVGWLAFSTGEQRLFDASILTGSAYKPLSDEDIFKNCKVVDGVVTWLDEEIDCAPEYMYVNSYEYPSLKPAI